MCFEDKNMNSISIVINQKFTFMVLQGSFLEKNINEINILHGEICMCMEDKDEVSFNNGMRKIISILNVIYYDLKKDQLSNAHYYSNIVDQVFSFISFLQNTIRNSSFDIAKHIARLKSISNEIYEENFNNKLQNKFWFELLLYEWLLKEKMLHTHQDMIGSIHHAWHAEDILFIHSPDQLENFFNVNRQVIIFSLANTKRDLYSGKFIFLNPLDDQTNKKLYEFHKIHQLNNEKSVTS